MIRKIIFGLIVTFLVSKANAESGISIASGHGVADIVPIRVGVQKSWHKTWRDDCSWKVKGFWEASFYHLSGKKGVLPNSNKRLNALALAPVFRITRQEAWHSTYPYLELAIGIAQLSKREIGGRWLGTKFQFEDRLGIGFKFGDKQQFDLNYRLVHFSNAYIGNYNHGINLQMLTLGVWF